MRFAVRWGEVWKGAAAMAPPAPESAPAKMPKSMNSAPTLHLDTNKDRWVRTWSPAPHYRPAADMKPKEFARNWQTASKEALHPDELEHGHSDASAHESQRKTTFAAARHPGNVDGQMAGGKDWWKRFGFQRKSTAPEWDGKWADHTVSGDPSRYSELTGVTRALPHMNRLREMRANGDVPDGVLDTAALFAITSKRVASKQQAKVFPSVTDWISRPEHERTRESLVDAMRPLGHQNTRADEYMKTRSAFRVLKEGMRHFPHHGPSLRDWISHHHGEKFPGLGNAKLSFLLQTLGYSDVACIDGRVMKHLTGALRDERSAGKMSTRLARDPHLYGHFERRLRQTQAFRPEDPEHLRLGMAQWRMWDAEGDRGKPTDTDHAELWRGIADVTGHREFSHGLKSVDDDVPRHFETSQTLARAMHHSFENHGAGHPHRDITPTLLGAFPQSRHATRPTGLVLVRGGSKPAGSPGELQRAHQKSTAKNAMRFVSPQEKATQEKTENATWLADLKRELKGHYDTTKAQLELGLTAGPVAPREPEQIGLDLQSPHAASTQAGHRFRTVPQNPGYCNACDGRIGRKDERANDAMCGGCLTQQKEFELPPVTTHGVVL